MAGYKEFRNEEYYKAPDISILTEGLNKSAENVGRIFSSIAQRHNQRKSNADNFKYTMEYGLSENDNKFNEMYANNVVQLGQQAIRRNDGTFQTDIVPKMEQGKRFVADQKAQADRYKKLHDEINGLDQYDDKNYYRNTLDDAFYGKDGDQDFRTRTPELEKAANKIGKDPYAFKVDEQRADWIKNYQIKTIDKESATPYEKSGTTVSTPFFDYTNGKPGASDDTTIKYLKSDPRVDLWYNNAVGESLKSEIKQMRASGNPKNSWMEGKSDIEVMNELINDPSKNMINSTDYGVRKRDMAKADLNEMAGLVNKTSYETKVDMTKTAGKYTNDKITYGEFSENTPIQNENSDAVAEAFGTNGNYSVGANLSISSGTTIKPITFRSSSTNVFNTRTGEAYDAIGGTTLNLTGYQLQLYKKDGTPYTISAKDTNEFLKKIGSIPDADLKNLNPKMEIALRGYTLNKGSVLGEIAKNKKNLEEELGAALRADDAQKVANLQTRIASMQYAVQSMNQSSDEYSDEDLMSSLRTNGIKADSFQNDVLLKASNSDLAFIQQTTQGLDLRNPEKWSRDMVRAQAKFTERYNKAAGTGFAKDPQAEFEQAISKPVNKVKKSAAPAAQQTQPASVPTVSSQADYDKLPAGSEYLAPDGKKYRKK